MWNSGDNKDWITGLTRLVLSGLVLLLPQNAGAALVTWDLGNEHDFHREVPKWADWLGPLVRQWDPYDHLLSAHNKVYRTPGQTWNDLQLIQRWDAGQNAFMLGERVKQAATGRAIPQVNEEYGYEDLWEKSPGQRAAETRRRLAWEISMAGCYQTTRETANRGTAFPPDTGGGWVNGRGDDSMTMLRGYAHLVDFFTSFDWWRGEPRNDLVRGGAFCLAEPGKWYAVYLPRPASIALALEPGNYHARWFHPRTGQWLDAPVASGPTWMPPATPDDGDWALLLRHDPDLVDTTPPSPVTAVGDLHRGEVRVTFSKPLGAARSRSIFRPRRIRWRSSGSPRVVGTSHAGQPTAGGGKRSLQTPFRGPAVLLLGKPL